MFIKEITEESIGLPETQMDLDTAIIRLSVRGVIHNTEGKIAMIRTKTIMMLPGGGTDGQPLEDAWKREILEEVGAEITDTTFLGLVREYRLTESTPMIVQSHAFSARVQGELQPVQLQEEEIEE
jgi:8-oxo-dGTP pyrophosphatase MutT (NUDIX family)